MHDWQCVKIRNPEHGECSKTEAEESQYWSRWNWDSRKQELKLNMKVSQMSSLHRRLRGQYLVKRKHSERWSEGISHPVRFSFILRYRRQWHLRSTVLTLRSTPHQKQHDTLKSFRYEIFWRHSSHRRSYLSLKSVCLFFLRIDSNKSSESQSFFKRKDTESICQSISNLSRIWRTTHHFTFFRYDILNFTYVSASR